MISEATLAASAAEWLRAEGWETYFEVSLEWKLRGAHPIGDARADIVGTRDWRFGGRRVAVVECKAQLSFELFAQARRWLPYADCVWMAVPYAKRSEGRDEAFRLARECGLGVLELSDPDIVRERAQPTLEHIRSSGALLDSLCPEHKTHAQPGTNRGGQWTSFKRTADAIAAFVKANPACTIAEACAAVEHHYRSKQSAIASITKAVKKGLIPGVETTIRQRLIFVASTAAEGASE